MRIGFKHKDLCDAGRGVGLNIAWESIYAVHALATSISVQGMINIIWALVDLVIVYTFFRFGRSELPEFVTGPMFIAWGALVFISSYIVQWMFIVQFGWNAAARL